MNTFSPAFTRCSHRPMAPGRCLLFLLLLTLACRCAASPRKLTSLYHPPALTLTYHNGPLLEGPIPVSILWYGNFTPSQRSIVSDFVLSLTPPHRPTTFAVATPTVAAWWRTVDLYIQKAGKRRTHVLLTNQLTLDPAHSAGRLLRRGHITDLARRLGVMPGGVAIVLTAADVAVDGFCSSACGLHGSTAGSAYVWVGDPASQCPGQCAWPFHEPAYGPRGPALGPPNRDVGVDGMVISLASLIAGAVTNPYGDGYFDGDPGAPVEVGGACPGMYGEGAYPGYPGKLRTDPKTRGSYNVEGENGRKYFVPALLDPVSHKCLPMA